MTKYKITQGTQDVIGYVPACPRNVVKTYVQAWTVKTACGSLADKQTLIIQLNRKIRCLDFEHKQKKREREKDLFYSNINSYHHVRNSFTAM